VLNVIAGGNDPGAALVEHDDVDMVSLTGSVETGKWIAEHAAKTLKRVHLELGGKAPVVVFDDVVNGLVEQAAGYVMGDTRAPETTLGPVNSARQRERASRPSSPACSRTTR
jgi:betaine-aldehyde dehydrogenase